MSQPSTSDGNEKPTGNVTQNEANSDEYPSSQKRILIMAAIYLATFLVTLVRQIFCFER